MTPEYVAEGFYNLVTKADNGSVMWSLKDTPYLIIPDDSELRVLILVLMAKLMRKMTGTDLITPLQIKLFFFGFVIFMIMLCNLFF